ncbi:glycosyltransferase family 2 protein [bacterium]|nr:glycosyltransferase family 2 protein [bacterium]
MKLSVIIPAYNEENRIPKTLREIDKYLKEQPYEYEILVVNDGSSDNTVNIVNELKKEIPNLKLIDNKENHGKGYVVRQGMLTALGAYRLFTDADNSTSIDQIEKMWPWFEQGYDIVIGSRDVEGAKLDPPQPFIRRFIGDIFKLIRKIICGLWDVQDTQCGFKCFTAKAADDIFSLTKIDGFSFDVEALLIGKHLGYKIKEVPVVWKNNLESKVRLKSAAKMLTQLLQIRMNLLKGVYAKKERK